MTININSGNFELNHERAGLEADVSAGDGFVEIKGGATTVIKSNLAAAVAPTANEDSDDGYTVGSRWIDTTADKEYVLLDATVAAAVWTETTYIEKNEPWGVAASDETTVITTGTGKASFSIPWAYTVTAVYASVNTGSTSGVITIDINEDGTSILSTKLTIDQDEKSSITAAAAAVISDSSIAAGAEITVDFDGVGVGAKGAKIILDGYRT